MFIGDVFGFFSVLFDKVCCVVYFIVCFVDWFVYFKGYELGEFFFVFEY